MTPPPSTDRRSLLQTSAALLGVAATGGLAGCLGDSGSDTPDGQRDGDTGRVGYVPAMASGVGYVDVETFLADTALRDGIDRSIASLTESAAFSEQQTLDGWLDTVAADTGFDFRQVREILGFHRVADREESGGGVVLWTDWSKSTLLDEFGGEDGTLTEETYRGTTLYSPEAGGPLADLGDGTYAIGTDAAVRSVVDRRQGDDDGLSGQLRSVYTGTRGMGRYAAAVPERAFAGLGVGEVDTGTLSAVETAATSVYRDGSSRVVDVSMVASSADAAEDVRSTLLGGKQLLLDRIQQLQSEASGSGGRVEQFYLTGASTYLEDATVARDGSTVTVRYAAPPAEFARNSPVTFLFGGVLLNTAGFVRSSTEETGEGSAEQVSSRLRPVRAVGTDVADGSVGTVELVVAPTGGGSPIDIRDVVVRWADESEAYTLVHAEADADGATGTYGVSSVADDDGSIADSGVVNAPADRAGLRFDVGQRDTVPGVDSGAVPALEAGERVTLHLITGSGARTAVVLTVPETLAGEGTVRLL